ncbi:MAG TPA: outer membrane beta-barrel protein, partial [Chitinophagaceae bacterium]|nr:outer membrane beta-barrel protein [Chitinophagaceae bacterium]
KEKGSSSYNMWYTWVMGMKYTWSKRFATGLRLEYYQDKNGVIVSTETGAAMAVFGASMNLDVQVLRSLLWRLEARMLSGEDVFLKEGMAVNGNQAVTTSIAFHF